MELSSFEEERQMPYVTSIERLAEARGETRGKASVVLAVLAEILGSVPEEHQERIRNLSSKQLDQLVQDRFLLGSLADLQNWLDQHAGADD